MIVSGKAIAEDIYTELAPQFSALSRAVKLGIIVGGASPVIESFVRIKTRAAARLGVEMVRVDLPEGADTAAAIAAVKELSEHTDSVIVQLPLPKEIDTNKTLAAIPPEKDVDALNPSIPDDQHAVFAPVALAAVEILKRSNVTIEGSKAIIVGAGRLVGAPSAVLMKRLGARVSLFTLQQGSIDDLKDADIVVLGTGNSGFIKPEHLKEGVALIDAGASESKGRVVGDADPACAEKAAVFTPVPGGVGPVAVAMIFRNLYDLLQKARS